MKFRVERHRKYDGGYPWVAEIKEVLEDDEFRFGRLPGTAQTYVGFPRYVFAFTRWGLRIAVKRKCREMKRAREKTLKPAVPHTKRWEVEL